MKYMIIIMLLLHGLTFGQTPGSYNTLDFDGTTTLVTLGEILTPSYTKEAWIKVEDDLGPEDRNILSGDAGNAFWVVSSAGIVLGLLMFKTLKVCQQMFGIMLLFRLITAQVK
ncbi:MAG: hypothetical protein AAF149_17980 [Bacteroidota bacterium]